MRYFLILALILGGCSHFKESVEEPWIVKVEELEADNIALTERLAWSEVDVEAKSNALTKCSNSRDECQAYLYELATAPPALPSVYFAFNSFVPPAGVIEEIAELIGDGAGKIVVTGWADSCGPEAYNLDLSSKRANAVVNALVAMEVACEWNVVPMGEPEEGAGCEVGKQNARLRRVDLEWQ